jgi:hypothetical protein
VPPLPPLVPPLPAEPPLASAVPASNPRSLVSKPLLEPHAAAVSAAHSATSAD